MFPDWVIPVLSILGYCVVGFIVVALGVRFSGDLWLDSGTESWLGFAILIWPIVILVELFVIVGLVVKLLATWRK